MLDLGDPALFDTDGRWLYNNDVSVAAALISTSPSASTSGPDKRLLLSPRFPPGALPLPRLASAFDPRPLLPPGAIVRAPRGSPNLGEGAGLTGAATGGSLALRIVRVCLATGGARIDVNKVCDEDPVLFACLPASGAGKGERGGLVGLRELLFAPDGCEPVVFGLL